MGMTPLANSVPLQVAQGLQLLLTAFAFLQVRQLLAVPGSPPPACGKGLKSVGLGSGVGAVLLLSPKAFSPSWLEAVLPCSCAGHPLLCLPPVQSPEMISELGGQQTAGHSQLCSDRALLMCWGGLPGHTSQVDAVRWNMSRAASLRELQGLQQHCESCGSPGRDPCPCPAGSCESVQAAAAVGMCTLLHGLAARHN